MKTTTAKTFKEAVAKVDSRQYDVIKIPPAVALQLLLTNTFPNDNDVAIMVKGYNEDYDNYTGLYPDDVEDGGLADWWEDYQLWVTR